MCYALKEVYSTLAWRRRGMPARARGFLPVLRCNLWKRAASRVPRRRRRAVLRHTDLSEPRATLVRPLRTACVTLGYAVRPAQGTGIGSNRYL